MFATVVSAYRRNVLAKKRKYVERDGEQVAVKSGTETDFNLTVKRLSEFMANPPAGEAPRSPNGEAFRVAELNLTTQRAFWRHLAGRHGLSVRSIAIYSTYVAAAVNAGLRPFVEIVDGVEREITLLTSAPRIESGDKVIAEAIGKPATNAPKKQRLLTFKELAAALDAIPPESEHAFRYAVIAMNTWARPEAITDLDFAAQVDLDFGIVDLNPAGRTQTKKRRPIIPLTENLRAWAAHWDDPRPIRYKGHPVAECKKPIRKAFEDAGLQGETRYTFRSFMASHVRRMPLSRGRRVSRDQISTWLGHQATDGSDTTDFYLHLDPDFLREAREATDRIIQEISRRMKKRSLIAPNALAKRSHLRVVSGQSG